jgi:hypothetical protein
MKADFPKIDQNEITVPHAQEIEYALTLQRMINRVKEDPAEMRLAIYEFARARLKIDTSWSDKSERERLLNALETAIRGVENFSLRHDDVNRLPPPSAQAQIGQAHQTSKAVTTVEPIDPAPPEILVSSRAYRAPDIQVVELRSSSRLPVFILSSAALVLAGALVGLTYHRGSLPHLAELTGLVTKPTVVQAVPPNVVSTPATAVVAPPPAASQGPGFPLPSDYGVYALNGEALSELSLLPERVPDKRIAMSTPINEPSRITLGDGKVKFVLFRRDLIGNAPERVDVRVIARVVRALTFDAKGKANFTPVSDAWNIRNISYELRVRPIPGNPEMLLVQAEKSDFALPPGRYILVLKDQGYDFTVAGEITDPNQCLERTDAMNGSFYSECKKP